MEGLPVAVTDGICNVFKEDELRSNTPSNLHDPVEQATACAFSKSCLFACGAEVLAWEARCDEVVLTEFEGCVKGSDVIVNRYKWEVFTEDLLTVCVVLNELCCSEAS